MIQMNMFKVECNNCGRTGSLSLYRSEIISDGSVIVVAGDGNISTVYCTGCNEKIESEY